MINLRSSGLLSDQAVSSRGGSISGEGLHRSSKRPSAQADSSISMAPAVEEDESNCSCLTVMTEKVCGLWTACYETVSPSITAFCNWVSNLFTGANQESVGGMDDESALQRDYSTILRDQIINLFEFVRRNCRDETVVTLSHQESTRAESAPGVVNPTRATAAHVVVENIEGRIEGAEEHPALALLERPAGVEGPTVAREDGEG